MKNIVFALVFLAMVAVLSEVQANQCESDCYAAGSSCWGACNNDPSCQNSCYENESRCIAGCSQSGGTVTTPPTTTPSDGSTPPVTTSPGGSPDYPGTTDGGIATGDGSQPGGEGTVPTTPCEASPEIEIYEENNYEGVAADGKASVTIIVNPIQDIKSFTITLQGLAPGKSMPTENSIKFTPNSAEDPNTYLNPEPMTVVVNYIDKCNNPGTKEFLFTVEQPPVLLLHGYNSDPSIYGPMTTFLQNLGFQVKAINYPAKQSILASAALLAQELQTYLNEIRGGNFYRGKKVSAEKIDIGSHSMGGLITREYSTTIYQDDIRKFIMMGTPNGGSGLSSMGAGPLSAIGLGGGSVGLGDAFDQLAIGSPFLTALNARALNTSINHFTIAGITWSTINPATGNYDLMGDGIVHNSSVTLPGVPHFCTYDTHSAGMSGVWTGTNISSTTGLVESPLVMNIVHDLLLRSSSTSGLPCVVPANATTISATSKAWGKIKGKFNSPGNLHAYDGQGNHTGMKENGEIESGVPGTVYLEGSTEGRHFQMIEYANDPEHKGVYFKISGNDSGPFTFDVLTEYTDGSVEEQSFEGEITPSMQLQLQPSKDTVLNVDAQNDGVFETFMYGIKSKYPLEQQSDVENNQGTIGQVPIGDETPEQQSAVPPIQQSGTQSLVSLLFTAVLVFLLLAVLAGAGYWFVQNQKAGKKK